MDLHMLYLYFYHLGSVSISISRHIVINLYPISDIYSYIYIYIYIYVNIYTNIRRRNCLSLVLCHKSYGSHTQVTRAT